MDLDQQLNHKSGFRYPPIDPRTQIRLLRPLPVKDPTIPGQHRYVFELADVKDLFQIPYKALSYTWGSAASTEHLEETIVNGQPFWVRRNLHDFLVSWHAIAGGNPRNALQHFAKRMDTTDLLTGEGGLLFIDAICINQLAGGESNTERQAQVHLMREIYHRADGVISWLGVPPDDKTRHAVQALAIAVRTRRNFGSQAASWTPAQREGHRYLSHNRYWSRVWVLQEILLARESVICCGEFVFPLALFAGQGGSHASTAAQPPGRDQTPAERVTPYRLRTVIRSAGAKSSNSGIDALAQGTIVLPLGEMISELRKKGSVAVWETLDYQSNLSDSLHDIMARYGHLECSDPRDKLYGFLGLLKDKSRKAICVDYDRGADFAFYQGLKAGVTELIHDIEAGPPVSGYDSLDRTRQGRQRISRFHEDMRHAFRRHLSVEEAGGILQKVLDELLIEQWLAEVDSALLQRENGYGSEIVSWRDFQKLSFGGQNTAARKDPGVQDSVQLGGWLHRWHAWQYKAVARAKKSLFSKNRGSGD